jgi:gamma-glutamyl-gamma-aminobutyrate hydrolase PuuD
MKRIILSRDKGDEEIKRWFSAIGIETLSPGSKMDSWIDGLVIGGGSDPGIPEDKERDKMERDLITEAVKNRVPVLGICRGAEIITVWAGGSLAPLNGVLLSGHQHTWHSITVSEFWPASSMDVWSHHHLAIESTGSMKPAALSRDGGVEAIISQQKRVLGVLWHPERSGEKGYLSIYPWLKWIEKRF